MRDIVDAEALVIDNEELNDHGERWRDQAIENNIVSGERSTKALLELVTALHTCRTHNPRIWGGFVSTRLEQALACAKVELQHIYRDQLRP